MRTFAKIVVTGLGTGYLPFAPGTWGSGAVCAIYLLAAWLGPHSPLAANGTMLVILLTASVGCVAFGRQAEQIFGKKDPSQCVIDEWAGQALALLLLPVHLPLSTWYIRATSSGFGIGETQWAGVPYWQAILIATGLAFVAFRVFDIIKPPPARQLEKLPFGWGVLLDDLAAGLYANVACQLVLRLGFHLT